MARALRSWVCRSLPRQALDRSMGSAWPLSTSSMIRAGLLVCLLAYTAARRLLCSRSVLQLSSHADLALVLVATALLRQRSRSRISARRRRSRTKPRKEQGLARSTAARDTVAQAKAL